MKNTPDEQFDIGREALVFYNKHYPFSSEKELDKQIKDWQNKVEASGGIVSFFQDRVGQIKGKKVLDVGFGSGGVSIAFNKAGAAVVGVDVEPDLKPIAQKNAFYHGANIDFIVYEGRELPFGNDSFDYIVCCSVFEHMSFPQRMMSEMLRVLKPEGKMLLTLPNKYYPKETHTLAYFVSYMPRWMARIYLKVLKRSPLEHDNLHFYSYFNIVRFMKNTGYKYEILYKDLKNMKGLKRLIASILKKLGVHYTVFLRQLMFIVEKK